MSGTIKTDSAEFLGKLYELIQGVRGAEIVTSDGDAVNPESDDGQRIMVSVPQGRTLTDITERVQSALPNPRYRVGNIELKSMVSLCSYARRMRMPNSVILADKDLSALKVIFDHHDAINREVAAEVEEDVEIFDPGVKLVENDFTYPRWGRFTATYKFPFSKAWLTWSQMHGQPMSQESLAEWFESNIDDVLDVSAPEQVHSDKSRRLISLLGLKLGDRAALIRSARGMRLTINEEVHQAVSTTTGEVEVKYVQQHNQTPADGVPSVISIPSAFVIAVPVYEGGEVFEMLVRLRYRRQNNRIMWSFDIYQIDRAVEMAFNTACETIHRQTGIPLYAASLA